MIKNTPPLFFLILFCMLRHSVSQDEPVRIKSSSSEQQVVNAAESNEQAILEQYIQTGLESNLAIKQKQSSYQKSIQALKEAKGMFYPAISLSARYSVAHGGREIDLPIGDMLNPVYENLNMINQHLSQIGAISPGQINQYPLIDNETINFLRPTEHETKLRLMQPLFNPSIYYNHKIKEELTQVEKHNLDAYKRHLVAEIKQAYYQYLQTIELSESLLKNKQLVRENIRVNQRLVENDKQTIENVYKAQEELAKIEQEIAVATEKQKSAAAYFNFLLNRPLLDKIRVPETSSLDTLINPKDTLHNILNRSSGNTQIKTDASMPATDNAQRIIIDTLQSNAHVNREEINKLRDYIHVKSYQQSLYEGNKLPTLSTVVDYGFQGSSYEFNMEQDFVLASVVLKWKLFKGFQNRAKIEQAAIEKAILEEQYEELKSKIDLEIINAFYELESAYSAVIEAQKQLKTSSQVYKLVKKKYQLGQIPYVRMLEARTSFFNGKKNLIMKKTAFKMKYAKLERVAGLYQF